MAYTNVAAVQILLGSNYGEMEDGTFPDLQTYIDSANVVVTQMRVIATREKRYYHPAVELEMVERWLAAHLYTKMDPFYSNKSTAGASAGFVQGRVEKEPYKDGAINMDASGVLNALLNRQFASMSSIGNRAGRDNPGCGTGRR